MTPFNPKDVLRSPRAELGGFVILPRLIDKLRLHAQGRLPREYIGNLLKPGFTFDGRFLSFTGIDPEDLRRAILAADSDAAVLAWVEKHTRPIGDAEKKEWIAMIDAYRPQAEGIETRKKLYPDLAAKTDVGVLSGFDLVDMDEGRLPAPKK